MDTCEISICRILVKILRLADDIHLTDEEWSSVQNKIELTRGAAPQVELFVYRKKIRTIFFGDRNIE